MLLSNLISLSSGEQYRQLMEEKGHLVIDLFAEWCPPCRQLLPILDKVSLIDKYNSSIKFLKIDVATFPELAREYEVSSIPTLIFLYEGRRKAPAKYIGLQDEEKLVSLIDNYFFS